MNIKLHRAKVTQRTLIAFFYSVVSTGLILEGTQWLTPKKWAEENLKILALATGVFQKHKVVHRSFESFESKG